MYKKVKETSEYLNKSFNNESIHSAIILGSGMGGFEDKFEKIYSLDYSDIPNFIKPSVEGHTGNLSLVKFGERLTAIFSGRAHFYEGYDLSLIHISEPTRPY